MVPGDRTHMSHEGEIDLGSLRITFLDDPIDFLGLPVDDAGQNQCQATARGALLLPISLIDPAPFPIVEIPSQSMDLFGLQQPAPGTLSQSLVRHVGKNMLGLKDPSQFSIGTVEVILTAVAVEPVTWPHSSEA